MIAMTDLIKVSRNPRIVIATTLLILFLFAPFAISQINPAKPPTRHFEYVHQEVLIADLTKSLNDLDGQGWEVFQVVPIWQIKNDNAETLLAPRAYELFGRRAATPK
jgi:hypothetical protein